MSTHSLYSCSTHVHLCLTSPSRMLFFFSARLYTPYTLHFFSTKMQKNFQRNILLVDHVKILDFFLCFLQYETVFMCSKTLYMILYFQHLIYFIHDIYIYTYCIIRLNKKQTNKKIIQSPLKMKNYRVYIPTSQSK